MLNIKIIGVNPNGSLDFKVNGRHSNNGNGSAEKNWSVRWKVKRGIAVKSITDIQKKNASPDIFIQNPPRMQDSRRWKAKVDSTVNDYTDYHYSILWKDIDEGDHTHDPIISIKPSESFFDITKVVLFAATAVLALLTLQFLRKNRK
jgi:hypothetical protein